MYIWNRKFWVKPRLRIAAFLVCSAPFLAYGDLVNQFEIITFVDGQPAVAAEVNGNFQEVIKQIDDNASRIVAIEGLAGSILTTGDDIKEAFCDIDGPQALQSVIGSASNHTSRLTITVTGVCDPVSIVGRSEVVISGGTIKGNASTPDTLIIQRSSVQLIGTTVDANGDGTGINAARASSVSLIGATIKGAVGSQIFMNASTILFLGSNSIGESGGSETGLQLTASQAYLVTVGPLTVAALTINSGGAAMSLMDSLFQARESVPGTTTLTIPNAAEVSFEGGSVGYLSQSAITLSDRLSITDNSVVTVEEFGAGEAFELNARVLVDRGSVLRFDLEEDDPSGLSVTHTGDMEVGLNSVVDGYGSEGNPGTLTLVSGGRLDVNVNSSFVANSATIGATDIYIRNATGVLAGNNSFSGGVQPNINVQLDGTFIDLNYPTGVLTQDVGSCFAGGSAYGVDPNDPDVCP